MTLKKGKKRGRYTINRLIGRGGWGEVYEAVDPELDRLIALKLLPTKLALDPTMRDRDYRADGQGRIKLLEVNPNPACVWKSSLQLMAATAGHDYPEVLDLLLTAALDRIEAATG